jgi:hypothetical protein
MGGQMGQLEAYYGQFGLGVQGQASQLQKDMLAALGACQNRRVPVYSGNKPIVICGGEVNEAKDLDDAQRMAEESAHAKGKNAYILKPIKMVAPKRDVVTTDL